ncbi:hypothetical protein, partial [Proteiniclasticum sp.]|uniref:hypothetical protein n=1 Tax=Proteiniclasticum sp. TaxID=2053595 RepID=UPI00289D162F
LFKKHVYSITSSIYLLVEEFMKFGHRNSFQIWRQDLLSVEVTYRKWCKTLYDPTLKDYERKEVCIVTENCI